MFSLYVHYYIIYVYLYSFVFQQQLVEHNPLHQNSGPIDAFHVQRYLLLDLLGRTIVWTTTIIILLAIYNAIVAVPNRPVPEEHLVLEELQRPLAVLVHDAADLAGHGEDACLEGVRAGQVVPGERQGVGQLGDEVGRDVEGLVDVVARYGRLGGTGEGGDTTNRGVMADGCSGRGGLSEALGGSLVVVVILAGGARILVTVAAEEEVAKNLQPVVDMATMRRVSDEDGYRRFFP